MEYYVGIATTQILSYLSDRMQMHQTARNTKNELTPELTPSLVSADPSRTYCSRGTIMNAQRPVPPRDHDEAR
jgi:hypothetical protein